VNPFDLIGLPQRLLTQALDDLHEIATGGRSFMRLMSRLEQRADAIQAQLDATLAAAQALNDLAERALKLLEQLDARGESVLKLGKRIDERGKAMVKLGEEIDARAGALLGLGERIDERGSVLAANAEEVANRAAELIGVLPTLERAVAIATPLEGAVERLGRMVDRLPGEGRRSSAG
jgi:hypothetical protein